jgi:hypothetical protein
VYLYEYNVICCADSSCGSPQVPQRAQPLQSHNPRARRLLHKQLQPLAPFHPPPCNDRWTPYPEAPTLLHTARPHPALSVCSFRMLTFTPHLDTNCLACARTYQGSQAARSASSQRCCAPKYAPSRVCEPQVRRGGTVSSRRTASGSPDCRAGGIAEHVWAVRWRHGG